VITLNDDDEIADIAVVHKEDDDDGIERVKPVGVVPDEEE
jgi:hypothetical protein